MEDNLKCLEWDQVYPTVKKGEQAQTNKYESEVHEVKRLNRVQYCLFHQCYIFLEKSGRGQGAVMH